VSPPSSSLFDPWCACNTPNGLTFNLNHEFAAFLLNFINENIKSGNKTGGIILAITHKKNI
jgi:hypothetical protein